MRLPGESEEAYQARLSEQLADARAKPTWKARCGCGRELVARRCPHCRGKGCHLCDDGELLACSMHYHFPREGAWVPGDT